MEKKKIFIGLGLLVVGTIGYFALTKKTKKEQVIKEEGEADFDFENADGKKKTELQNIISSRKIIKVKDYQALIKNGTLQQLKKYLVGKNIYTLKNDVNLRSRPSVNNGFMNSGFFDNKLLTIKNKGVYIGKVENVLAGKDGYFWFSISNKGYNPIISETHFIQMGYLGIAEHDKRDYVYVRADVVVVDLY